MASEHNSDVSEEVVNAGGDSEDHERVEIDGGGSSGSEDHEKVDDESCKSFETELYDLTELKLAANEDGVVINVVDVDYKGFLRNDRHQVRVHLGSSVKSLQAFMAKHCRFPPDEPGIYKGIVLKPPPFTSKLRCGGWS
ncbi:hypothetical protein ACOSP7_005958 [Xanthoceras sorbifolium]